MLKKIIFIFISILFLGACHALGSEPRPSPAFAPGPQVQLTEAGPSASYDMAATVIEDDFFEDTFSDYYEKPESVPDPLYPLNYFMHSFNDMLYFAFLKPVATIYEAAMPGLVRSGISNFFHNLLFPVRFVNNLLQGEIHQAGSEFQIFLVNSTIGLLGFMQVAQNEFGLSTIEADLGQTLGRYSVGKGFYLVLPVIGPSTLRDTVGLAGDFFLTPLNYVEPSNLSMGIKSVDTVNAASFRLGEYEAMRAAAIDPYVALRDAYIQNREKKIQR